MRGLFWALLTFAAAAWAGEESAEPPFAWRQHYGSSEHDNWRARKDGITWPKVRWHVKDARGEPTLEGDTVYAGGPELLAIDRKTGEVRARSGAGASLVYAQAPVLAGDRVVARRSDGRVRAYSRDLSRIFWEHVDEGFGGDYRMTGACREGLYVFAPGHWIKSIEVRTGRLAWEYRHDGAPFAVVPAIDAERVYAGARDGFFVALDRKTGVVKWSHRQDAAYAYAGPVVFEDLVLVGDRGVRGVRRGELRAFQAKTGRVPWEFAFGTTGLSTPGHRPGHALLGYGRVAAELDLKTRRVRTVPTSPNAFGSPTMVGENFYFGNLDGNLYAYGKNRELLWRFHVEGTIDAGDGREHSHQVGHFVHTGSEILVSTTNGLFCLVQDPEMRGKRPDGATIGTVPGE